MRIPTIYFLFNSSIWAFALIEGIPEKRELLSGAMLAMRRVEKREEGTGSKLYTVQLYQRLGSRGRVDRVAGCSYESILSRRQFDCSRTQNNQNVAVTMIIGTYANLPEIPKGGLMRRSI